MDTDSGWTWVNSGPLTLLLTWGLVSVNGIANIKCGVLCIIQKGGKVASIEEGGEMIKAYVCHGRESDIMMYYCIYI